MEIGRPVPDATTVAAAAGLLAGAKTTTARREIAPEQGPLGLLRAQHPQIDVVGAPVADSGSVFTSGGVN